MNCKYKGYMRTIEEKIEEIRKLKEELYKLKIEDDELGFTKGFYNRRRKMNKLSRMITHLFTQPNVLNYIIENKIRFKNYENTIKLLG